MENPHIKFQLDILAWHEEIMALLEDFLAMQHIPAIFK